MPIVLHIAAHPCVLFYKLPTITLGQNPLETGPGFFVVGAVGEQHCTRPCANSEDHKEIAYSLKELSLKSE